MIFLSKNEAVRYKVLKNLIGLTGKKQLAN